MRLPDLVPPQEDVAHVAVWLACLLACSLVRARESEANVPSAGVSPLCMTPNLAPKHTR